MLKIVVSGSEQYDEERNLFVPAIKEHTLLLEHSLLSIAKWESIYHKPFLSTPMDFGMVKEYAKCMSINPMPDVVYEHLSASNIDQITAYISDNCTATWFSDNEPAQKNGKMMGKTITAEIVYYWMIQMNIPVEFQKWHLNRLLTLIRVISIENDPKGNKQKMTNADRKALNMARRAKYHTRG